MNINLSHHHHQCLNHYYHHNYFPPPSEIMIAITNDDDTTVVASPETAGGGGGGHPTRFIPRGHWKPEEDETLKKLVAIHGAHNWNFIAQNLPGRSGKSCRLRWYNQLDPKVKRSTFTEKEEERLVEAQKMYGNKWAKIARLYFPGRTDNAVKNHWHVLLARNDRWWRHHHQINAKRMKHTNIVNNNNNNNNSNNPINGGSFNAVATESTVDSKSTVTASTCTTHLSLSPASIGRNQMPPPPEFQTSPTLTGSSSSGMEKGKQCYSPLPILSTPVVAGRSLGTSLSKTEEGKGRQCYSPLPILSTHVVVRKRIGSSSSRVEEGKGRQRYSPLPILSTPIVAEIGSDIIGSSSSRVGEGESRRGGQLESSNSEVTAAYESVANFKSTNQTNQLNKIAFFDFLGVGAT